MKKQKVIKIVLAVEMMILACVIGIALWQENDSTKNMRKVYYDTLSAINTAIDKETLESKMQELAEKNEEAKEFVENFANRENYLGKKIDLSDEVEVGVVPHLMQWDLRWGYESFGSTNIGLAGCGPTCMSMAYVYLSGDIEGNPKKMADFCGKEGYYTDQGTSWDFWTSGARQLGLEGAELSLDELKMCKALDRGSLVVCSMRPGDFTTTGHYILIHGYDEEGFQVNDPNSRKNSEKTWSYDTLKGQIRNLWELSGKENRG